MLEIFPAYSGSEAYRIEFFGDEVDRITEIDTLDRTRANAELGHIAIFPASHYVVPKEKDAAGDGEYSWRSLRSRSLILRARTNCSKPRESAERTNFDVEMMRETGFCSGIENYSRHLTFGKQPENRRGR